MQLQQNPLKLECPIIPEIDSPKKIIRISSLIFMELFTEILILVQCAVCNEPYQKALNDYGKGHSFDKQRELFMCLWHTTLVQTRVCKQMEYAIFLLINVFPQRR